MPSSSVEVATITQSRASANAGSARWRSSRASELCETNVVDAPLAQRGGELLDPGAAVAEDQPLLAAVQRGDHRGGVVDGADVVELDLAVGGSRPRPARRPTAGR